MANITDNFNRADATSIGTAPTGQTWRNFGGGRVGITSNRAETNVSQSLAGSVVGDTDLANATVQVTIVNGATNGNGPQGGIVFRMVDDSNYWVTQLSGDVLFTRKVVAGSPTDVTNSGLTIADGDVWSVECDGDSITVKQNGVTIRALTDSTHNTGTEYGLHSRPGAQYDDFSVTAVGGGGGNTAPTATITAPADATSVTEGDNVNFTGTGSDAEDGTLTGTSLVWTSSLDGAIGTGTSINVSTLSVGTHTIELTATDSGGLTDIDSISVTVNAVGGGGPQLPALPSVTPTRVSISGLSYTSSTTVTAANLQSTINAKAVLAGHHEIIVQDGELITTPVVLKARSNATGYIVIRSETLMALEGVQVHPSMVTTQAEFRQSGGGLSPIIYTEQGVTGVERYILSGLNVTSTSTDTNMLVSLGSGSNNQDDLSLVPDDIIVERCVMKADNARRAIAWHSGTTVITENWLSSAYLGSDSQAIHGGNGTGPVLIEHNYLEGAGENIMIGGQSTWIPDNIPSDITIRLNAFGKPFADWVGNQKSVKNLIEMKAARRVLIEGNFFENNWDDEQAGMSVLFKTEDQNLLSPWLQTSDVTFRYNFCRNMGGFINMTGLPEGTGVEMARVHAHDNVGVNIGTDGFTGDDRSLMMSGPNTGSDYRYTHNTVAVKPSAPQVMSVWLSGTLTNCRITDNIDARSSTYGVKADSAAEGTAAWNAHATGDAELTRNVISGSEQSESNYPAGNHLPSAPADIGFVDDSIFSTLGTADPSDVCDALTLAVSSPYKGIGDGGSDPGADMATIKSFLAIAYVPGQRSDDFASFAGPGPAVSTDAPVATALHVVTQPTDTLSGIAHDTQPEVEIRDQFGARKTDDTSTVTAELVTVSGTGTAIGTLTKAAVAGLASFTDLGVTSAEGGTFKWRFTDGALTLAESAAFNVEAPPVADSLHVVTQPNDAASGVPHTVQPAVEIRDQFAARLTSDTSTVTAELVAVVGSGTAIGTLTKAAVAGLATFVGLGVASAAGGTFKWRFTDGTLTLAESATFVVTADVVAPGGSTGGGTGVFKWLQRREKKRG